MSATVPSHTTETLADRQKSRAEHEARASGQLPPEVDVKTGSMINPHNPEFITKRPWYLGGGDEGPSLDHQASQKTQEEKLELSLQEADVLVERERKKLKDAKKNNKFKVGMWVEALKKNRKPYCICQITRISKKGTVFDLKYDDGTTEVGVKMKKTDRLMKNPRIRITKTGNRSFEVNHALHGKETYDSKRDKYHGFELQQHQDRVREMYAERDAIRRNIRAQTQREEGNKNTEGLRTNGSDSDSDYDSDAGTDSEDEFVQKDSDAKVHTSRLARQGGVGGAQMKVTARNLRIREDTAKYLRNLDPNSAYYDPKSRSLRDNPNPEADPNELQFAGDNFARISGDAIGLAQTQVFAWDMAKTSGGDNTVGISGPASSSIHPQANPSQAELMKKKFTTQSLDLKTRQKKAVLDKYGGAEMLDGESGLGSVANDFSTTHRLLDDKATEERKARFGVSIQEEHFTRDGRSAKNNASLKTKMNLESKYDEDLFINGHSTVWGSYFHKGAFRWGYADDHSLMKNSYCTGPTGRIANDEANNIKYGTGISGSAALAQARAMLKSLPGEDKVKEKSTMRLAANSKLYGESERNVHLDSEKLKAALVKEADSKEESSDDRKRRYNSSDADINVTEEDMELYRLKKNRTDDPMANFGSNQVLEYRL